MAAMLQGVAPLMAPWPLVPHVLALVALVAPMLAMVPLLLARLLHLQHVSPLPVSVDACASDGSKVVDASTFGSIALASSRPSRLLSGQMTMTMLQTLRAMQRTTVRRGDCLSTHITSQPSLDKPQHTHDKFIKVHKCSDTCLLTK
jgi:hypothetical protein